MASYPPLSLPRTTERAVRKRGDKCPDLPVRAALQSHGRKSVVRGLLFLDPQDWAESITKYVPDET